MATKAQKPSELTGNRCDMCPGCIVSQSVSGAQTCIKGQGYIGGLMVVGGSPSFFEVTQGEYMTSSVTAKALAREFSTAFIDLTSCYVTPAIKCYQGSSKIESATYKNCRELLLEEIDRVKPSHILLLGSDALQVLFKAKDIGKYSAKVTLFNNIPVFVTYDYAYVQRKPSLLFEFQVTLQHVARWMNGWKLPSDFKFTVLDDTPQAYHDALNDIQTSDAIAYDIESTGLDPDKDKILMLGIATRTQSYIVPLVTISPQKLGFLNAALAKSTIRRNVAHNSKFDNRWLRQYKIIAYTTDDTFLSAYAHDASLPHGLKFIAQAYLGAIDYSLGVEFKENLTAQELRDMMEYCALDVYYTLKAHDYFSGKISQNPSLSNVHKRIIIPAERILQGIEETGFYVNPDKLAEATKLYETTRDKIMTDINAMLPAKWVGTINLNSTKQLGELLFKDLKLPSVAKTSTGADSTGKSTLLRLASYHELPKLILEYRKYEKALVSFLYPWAEYIKKDGRIHTTYNIAQTATGRLSANDPNLQQCPRDKRVRELICAPKGKVFIEADYSQVELRVAAFIAGANSMKHAYAVGEDLHSKTAARTVNMTTAQFMALPDSERKPIRTKAKAVNFGFLYGMGWKKFQDYAFDSYGVVVTAQEAENARNAYFDLYPELAQWHERQRNFVRKHKQCVTPIGRIRHLPDVDSPDNEIRGGAERQGINTPVQSFASDITLLAMILIEKNLRMKYGDRAYLVGQVHDAIMVEADEDIGRDCALIVKYCMESVPKVLLTYFGVALDVPIVAEVEMGEAWGVGEIVE